MDVDERPDQAGGGAQPPEWQQPDEEDAEDAAGGGLTGGFTFAELLEMVQVGGTGGYRLCKWPEGALLLPALQDEAGVRSLCVCVCAACINGTGHRLRHAARTSSEEE